MTGLDPRIAEGMRLQLAARAERLRAGEVIITGSVVPPLPVTAGQRVDVDLGPLGGLSVALR